MKHRQRIRRPSKSTIFALLMGGALMLLLLPMDLLRPARDMTQLIALPQLAATRASEKLSAPIRNLAEDPIPPDQHADLVRQKQALENENAALRGTLTQLQATVNDLERIRVQPGFPDTAVLVPARTIAWDAVSARDAMVLLKARSGQARSGDWVTSRLAVEVGSEQGVQEAAAVLAREALIGRVEQTAPYVSRVVLLSDLTNEIRRIHLVAVNRPGRPMAYVTDIDRRQPLADFALQALGHGRMKVLDIDRRYVSEGRIQPGDLVTTDGRDPGLPVRMVIGEITEIRPQRENPLLYDAWVKHRYDPRDLRQVYIVNLTR